MPISPYTPRGTKVVCVDDNPHYKYCKPLCQLNVIADINGLKENQVYTVSYIEPSNEEINGFVVILREIVRPFNSGYSLNRFEYVAAPDVFEKILRSVKIPAVPKAAPVKERVG